MPAFYLKISRPQTRSKPFLLHPVPPDFTRASTSFHRQPIAPFHHSGPTFKLFPHCRFHPDFFCSNSLHSLSSILYFFLIQTTTSTPSFILFKFSLITSFSSRISNFQFRFSRSSTRHSPDHPTPKYVGWGWVVRGKNRRRRFFGGQEGSRKAAFFAVLLWRDPLRHA